MQNLKENLKGSPREDKDLKREQGKSIMRYDTATAGLVTGAKE